MTKHHCAVYPLCSATSRRELIAVSRTTDGQNRSGQLRGHSDMLYATQLLVEIVSFQPYRRSI